MSRDIVPQVDVGSLTLNSLSAFNSVLSAISADNIAPGSLIQLSSLGSHFHISGRHAAQTPDLLQRVSSTRLDRLGIVVGWRKGDAASYMAHSAGGQAASLLCLCLQNVSGQKSAKTGEILYDISGRILSRDQSVASIKQLGDAAGLLTDKLAPIGFGNVIAQEAFRIQAVYESLGKKAPTDIYNPLTRSSLVDLLESLSKVFSEEDCQLRVTGTMSAAFLLAMARILFDEDWLLVIEGHIIYSGNRHRIIFDVSYSNESNGSTRIELEHKLQRTPQHTLQLRFESLAHVGLQHQFSYTWHGHLRDYLDTSFSSVGLSCPEYLVVACCDEVLQLTQRQTVPPGSDDADMPVSRIEQLLGVDPISRVHQTFQTILRSTATGNYFDETASMANLAYCFANVMTENGKMCTCRGTHRCHWSQGWLGSLKSQSRESLWCVPRFLWLAIAYTISHTLTCIFVDTPDATPIRLESKLPDCISLETFEAFRMDQPIVRWRSCHAIYHEIFSRFGSLRSCENPLAASNGMSTLLPWPLVNLQLKSDLGAYFSLVDGQIIVKNQYYRHMDSVERGLRERQQSGTVGSSPYMRPSSIGEHLDVHFSVIENADGLELRSTVLSRQTSSTIDMFDPIIGSMGLIDASLCKHNVDAALGPDLANHVRETSVFAPLTSDTDFECAHCAQGRIAIVQTRSDRVAQLLACTGETKGLLQRRCCLSCAVREAMTLDLKQVIVACG